MRISLLRRRIRANRSTVVIPIIGICAVLAAGCVSTTPPQTATIPLAQLEANFRADSANTRARVELAAGYREADRPADAVRLLEPLVARDRSDAAAAFYLGLSYEDLGRFGDARRLYQQTIDAGVAGSLRGKLQKRIVLAERRELEGAARTAVQREAQLPAAPPGTTVGVFPFLMGAGESLRPLGRALAELLTTDLSQTTRVRVVERAQLQVLLDEIRLAEQGLADPATAARAGRMVGAGRVVQGRVDGSEAALRLQAVVVPVGTGAPSAPLQQQGGLQQLFDMQGQLALAVYNALGVELTVAERDRILRAPTRNVQALLAFGFGLESNDGGRFVEAVGHFQRAVQLDPNFVEARQ
jgi:tetratricopeptide (TPR) repeat protein